MSKKIELFKSKYHFFLIAIFSGILVGTSYIPYPAWAIFFCYIPLWVAVLRAEQQNSSLKFIFFLGWLTQFVLTLIGFHWIYYTATEFGQLPPVIAGAALALFAGLMHTYIPASLVLATWIKRKKNISQTPYIFLLSTFLILLERVWPSIFEWNLGYTLLWMKWPWFQWADTVGFWGLSSMILSLQAILLYLVLNYRKPKTIYMFSSLILVLFILHFGGQMKMRKWSKTNDIFQALVVQANVSNEEKIAAEKGVHFQPYILNLYANLTTEKLSTTGSVKPDALLWPETALPFPLDSTFFNRPNQKNLQNFLNQWNMVLITGGYSQDLSVKDHLGNSKVRNSIFFLSPQQGADTKINPSPYFKTDLLVFGEYMPFGKEFPILYKWLPFVGVYEKGPGPTAKKITTAENKNYMIGPQICYESLNPGFARGLSEVGADLIFNTTNDSWYGEGTEPDQHMIMTLGRAIEVRRPLVRATNTGFSTAILANGQQLEKSPMNKPWAHIFEIKYLKSAELTFYTQFGHFDYLLWILFLMFLIFWKDHYVRHQKS